MSLHFARRRGAAGQQYAIIVGLVAVLAISAVALMGAAGKQVLTRAGNTISIATNSSSAAAPAAPPPAPVIFYELTPSNTSNTSVLARANDPLPLGTSAEYRAACAALGFSTPLTTNVSHPVCTDFNSNGVSVVAGCNLSAEMLYSASLKSNFPGGVIHAASVNPSSSPTGWLDKVTIPGRTTGQKLMPGPSYCTDGGVSCQSHYNYGIYDGSDRTLSPGEYLWCARSGT